MQEGILQVDLKAPDGSISRIELSKDNTSWGSFSGRFKVSQPGAWDLKAFVAGDDQAFIEAKIISQSDEIEKTGRPARFEVLNEMAKITNGRVVTASQLDDLVKEINALPEPQPLVDSIKIWAHWLAPALLILLLSIFWIGRKLNGTF